MREKTDYLYERLSLNDRRASSKALKRDFRDASGHSVSTRTVRRRLLKARLKGCIAAKKPMLTAKHRTTRFNWAKERRNWKREDWAKILWSDESVFEIVPGRRVRVRRRVGEKYHPDCLVSTVKFGGGKVQVWGCMCRDGVGSLHVVDGRLNASAYIDLISPTLKDDGERIIGENFVFQQDGASCHTAEYSKKWFRREKISVLPWPSQSPDLNPIEHLWEVIKKKMDYTPVKNQTELKDLIFQTWNSITPDINC